jgi:hypothetical protein
MRTRAKRELFVGLQYLLLGVISELAVIRWFRKEGSDQVIQIVAWCVVFFVLTLLRFTIIVITSQVRRDQYQTISRRNWI